MSSSDLPQVSLGANGSSLPDLKEMYGFYQSSDPGDFREGVEHYWRSLQAMESPLISQRLEILAAAAPNYDVTFVTAITLAHLLTLRRHGVQELDSGIVAAMTQQLALIAGGDSLPILDPDHCAEIRERFWDQFARNRGQVTQEQWLELYGCEAGTSVTPSVRLRDNLVLGPVDAGSSFAFLLDPPTGITEGFTAEIRPQPSSPVVFLHDDRQMVLQTRPLVDLPHDARTQRFVITINGSQEYRVIVAVNPGVQIPVLPGSFVPRHSTILELLASGGPPDCSGLPPEANLPCGPMRWTWVGDSGTPLPSGLQLKNRPDGNAWLSGTIVEGARSSEGIFRLEQDGNTVDSGRRTLGVPVHFNSVARDAAAGPHRLERRQRFVLRLPQPFGGDGQNYSWSVDPEQPLPAGLTLIHDHGGTRIEGEVDRDAPLGRRRAVLRIRSPLSPVDAQLEFRYRIDRRFYVFTQNTYMRPEDAFPDSVHIAIAALLSTPWTAPFYWPVAGFAAGVEVYYDEVAKVQNSDEDNLERLWELLRWIRDRYDIVAFQELFDDPIYERIRDWVIQNNFYFLPGPTGKGLSVPDGFNQEALVDAFFKSRSGLGLLVRRDLATINGLENSIAGEAIQWARFNHRATMLPACHGVLGAGSDCLAQKGFTMSTVYLDGDSDEYLYVVNTHLDSDEDVNNKAPEDINARTSQLAQLATWVDTFTNGTHPVLFLGDFNIRAELPGSGGTLLPTGEYRDMITALKTEDLYRLRYPLRDASTPKGYTIDNQVNAYGYFWEGGADEVVQQRIDFMLVRQGTIYQLEVPRIRVVGDGSYPPSNQLRTTTECRRPGGPGSLSSGFLIDGPSQLRCWFSDHFGIEAELLLIRA